jgi:CheY-like chemotaxis protein
MQQPKRILLIDDDPDHLLICNLLLKKNGYSVEILNGCENMDEFLAEVETFRPHLIFMDHDMRGICGADLTRMLKSHEDFGSIPVVYFTGRSDIVHLAKQAGADGYLSKPFQTEGLLEATARYMS